jgi:hypothetical protein
VLTRPGGLSDSCLAAALVDGWGVRVDALEYLPLGFGSHHWRVDEADHRWFITVDDLDSRAVTLDQLEAALLGARSLRDRGLTFVVAPIRTTSGGILRREAGRFALALYPFVDGRSHSWGEYGSPFDRIAVLDLIVALHNTPPEACESVRIDDFLIPNRDELLRAIDDVDRRWDSGPHAEPVRDLVSGHAADLERLLSRYDRLVDEVRERSEPMVVTHGETHPGNTIATADGWVLIDWDTMLLAPPERDVWMLACGESSVIDAYERATGRTLSSSTVDMYQLRWDLADIAIYIAEFRRPHRKTADADAAWANLRATLTRLAADI